MPSRVSLKCKLCIHAVIWREEQLNELLTNGTGLTDVDVEDVEAKESMNAASACSFKPDDV